MDSVLNERVDSTIEEPCPNPFIQGAVKGLLETDLYQQKDINTLKKRVKSLESDMQAVKQRYTTMAGLTGLVVLILIIEMVMVISQ